MSTILIVDDSSTVRQELRGDLEAFGYHVIEAFDGEDGLKKVTAEKVDLLITDLNMPNMNGIAMCKQIHLQNIKIPILVMTTQTSAELKQEAKTYGVIAWIVKPYNKSALLSGIASILSR